MLRVEPLDTIKERLAQTVAHKFAAPRRSVRFVLSPYRICPIGAHVDHQGGPVLGMAIDLYTVLAFVPHKQPVVQLHSINFDETVVVTDVDTEPIPAHHWSRYLHAAVCVFSRWVGGLSHGLDGAVFGHLPGSGLSSSASVALAYLMALAAVHGRAIDRQDLVRLDQELENTCLGLQNGVLDQTTIAFAEAEKLLFIETLTLRVEPLTFGGTSGDYGILIAFSGISRELTSSGFNVRVQECRQAAETLAALANIPDAQRLGELPESCFRKYGHRLAPSLRRRAAHFFGEVQRVVQGREAWIRGDLRELGSLMNQSCESSLRWYESGTPELARLWEIVAAAPGVYGARFSGGGYGGCVVALAERTRAHEAMAWIEQRYAEAFPQYRERAGVVTVSPANGVRFA